MHYCAEYMCKHLNLKAGTMPAVAYKVPSDKVKYQDTWIDVIYGLIRDTLLNTKTAENPQGEWYRLADVYGEIRLDNLRDLQLPLVSWGMRLLHMGTVGKNL